MTSPQRAKIFHLDVFSIMGLLVVFAALMALGWWTGDQRAVRRDAELRDQQRQHAVDIALMLNPESVNNLSFTAADAGTPTYEVFCEILTILGKNIPNRGIYTMALRGGDLYYGPENYSPTDSMASPSGTRYEQPTSIDFQIFKDKNPVVYGPFTDEYGTFVTAMAPVVDSQTGDVLMVVGVDIEADDWQAQVNIARLPPLLFTFAAFFLLMIAAIAVRWRNRNRVSGELHLTFWIMMPVALAILTGLVTYTINQFDQVHQKSAQEMRSLTNQVRRGWYEEIVANVHILREQMEHFAGDPELIDAFQRRDRARLTEISRVKMDGIYKKEITYLYYAEPDRTCFLEVNQSDLDYHDIDCITMSMAQRIGEDTWGVEIGPMGIITLNHVRPLVFDGKAMGYLGLGLDTALVIEKLSSAIGVDIVSVIQKEHANRERYEMGKQAFGLEGEWNEYADVLVAYQTTDTIPDDLKRRLELGHNYFANDDAFRLTQGDRIYESGFIHLPDVAGRDVLDLIVMRDITSTARAERSDLFFNLGQAVFFFVGVLVLLLSVTRRAEGQLSETFLALRERVKELTCLQRIRNSLQDQWTIDQICSQIIDELTLAMQFPGITIPVIMLGDKRFGAFEKVERPDPCLHSDLESEGQVIGRLSVYYAEEKPFLTEEKDLVDSIARILSHDIERRRLEDALHQSGTRMRAITDSAQDAILMMDPDGNISYWNPAAERIFGYTSEEAIGQNLHAFIVPKRYEEAHTAGLSHFRQTGHGAAVGKTIGLDARRKDGQEIAVELSLSAIELNGRWHAVGILRDITERKQAEEILRESNRQLETAIAFANDMAAQAEMANQAKGEFLANMSHEIRTPMNGVIGMTGLLLDTDLDKEQRHFAQTVQDSAHALLVILNDILDFSKIEAGKLHLEVLDFDLRAMLDDFGGAQALRAQEKGLELICAAAPDVPTYLRGDPGRLRQALVNLVGNAIKFTHEGEIALRASLVSETSEEAVVRFSVKDTGIGILAEKQNMLFEKFTQADTSTTRKFGGTGLGLAISKQLVEMMGGRIGVRSELGQGAEFWFTACFAKQKEFDLKVLQSPDGIAGAHILIVDDNATNRDVLMTQLKAWKVRAEQTSDGASALKSLDRAEKAGDPFRVAIIDMQMPEMDGAELAKAIKANESIKDTRLVLMTSMGQRGDTKRMSKLGFCAYLTKPTGYSDLIDCLVAILTHTESDAPIQPMITRHTIREMRRGRVRILLAEDNITNQQVVMGILKKLGLSADIVMNGVEALHALEEKTYDLVLMDVQMPEMDGLEATRRIRCPQSTVGNPGIPIIAMTAHAMPKDRTMCLDAGMNDYIAKPLSPEALAQILDLWLPQDKVATYTKGAVVSRKDTPESRKAMEPPVFDHLAMMSRLMDDEDLARSVAADFLVDLPMQIESLVGYLDAGEIQDCERQAHTIKGASAMIGGEQLRGVAFLIENDAKAGDLDAVRRELPALNICFAQLREAMGKHFGLD